MTYRVYIGQYQKIYDCFAPTLYAQTEEDNLIDIINQALTKVHVGLDLYISKDYGKQLAFYREKMNNYPDDKDLLRFINERIS